MTPTLPQSPTSRVEAYSMLAHHALSALWASSGSGRGRRLPEQCGHRAETL